MLAGIIGGIDKPCARRSSINPAEMPALHPDDMANHIGARGATLQAERRRECYQPMIELVEVMCGVNLHGSSKATRSDRVSG